MTKFIVLFGVFLDILCLSVMVPAYPELIGLYHVPERYIALSIGVYALASFLAAPLLGQRSDKIGRKTPLLLCIGGTMVCFVVLLLTRSYWLFLIAKLINGITGGNTSILHAIMADISADNTDRKKNFGLFGALFGSAFIIGPLIGSFLLKQDIRAVFRAGLIVATAEGILVRLFYRETNTDPDPTRPLRRNPFGIYGKYLIGKPASQLLQSLGLIQIGIFAYQSVIPFVMYDTFAIPTHQMGRYLAGVGLLAAVNQGVLLGSFWLKRFSTPTLVVITHLTGIIAFAALIGYITNLRRFVAIRGSISVFLGIPGPVYQSEIIETTDKQSLGEINGLVGSIGSFSMVIGPLLGTFSLAVGSSIFRPALLLLIISGLISRSYLKRNYFSAVYNK